MSALTLEPVYLLIAAIVFLLIWVAYLEWRLKRLLRGGNGTSLESTIVNLAENVRQTDKTNEEIQNHLIKMEERLQRSIQHVKTVRFNPFADQGGNYSFAISLLDEHGDGVVISTLYSREKTGVYAKPIKHRGSEYELSAEERSSLEK